MINHPNRNRAAKQVMLGRLAGAFNEWQRQFIANPAAFESEEKTLAEFIRALNGGREPNLGERQAAYLMKLMGQLP